MGHPYEYAFVVARILLAFVFLANGLGIVDQTVAARELTEEGLPSRVVPLLMFASRSLELLAGIALGVGVFPQYAAAALLAFVVPATLISHSFWFAKNSEERQRMLKGFATNVAIWGGLILVVVTPLQPSLINSFFLNSHLYAILTA